MAHIVVEIVSYSDKRLIVRIEQKDMVGNILLTKKELIPDDWKLTISAVNFDRKDIDNLTIKSIKSKMERLGLRSKHLSNYTGIDK